MQAVRAYIYTHTIKDQLFISSSTKNGHYQLFPHFGKTHLTDDVHMHAC